MEANEIIKDLIDRGLTQAAIADRVGVKQPAISKVLRGETEDVLSATYRRLLALHAEVCGTKDALDTPPPGVSVANF